MKYRLGVIFFFLISLLGTGNTALASEHVYSGYPTFVINSVVGDSTVTIKTLNLPPNDTFAVLMNTMGTRGVNGIKVATLNTEAGGSMVLTYAIPASLHGHYRIAIRLESRSGSGYYAYNWFYNNTSGSNTGTGGVYPSGTTWYPTFSIVSVVRNNTVTIKTKNLPANDEFKVLMNYMGTRGIGGIKTTSFGTDAGGIQKYTFAIPAEYYGQARIAIRIESKSGSGLYAYNWFYNTTYP